MSSCIWRKLVTLKSEVQPCLTHQNRHNKDPDGPLTRYVKLWVVHAPGMPGTFSLAPRVSDPDIHQGTCVTHVPWCMLGSLTSGFLWIQWWGKRSRHSRRMHNPQFEVTGKRPIATYTASKLVSYYVLQVNVTGTSQFSESLDYSLFHQVPWGHPMSWYD